jgi:hypothetical protein
MSETGDSGESLVPDEDQKLGYRTIIDTTLIQDAKLLLGAYINPLVAMMHVMLKYNLEFLSCFRIAAKSRTKGPVRDMIPKWFAEITSAKQQDPENKASTATSPPIWLIFAVRAFDIYEIMGKDMGRGYDDLRSTAIKTALEIQAYKASAETLYKDPWKQGQRSPDGVILYINEWVKSGHLGVLKNGLQNEFGYSSQFQKTPFYFYKNHPLLCGLMVANITLSMQNIGIQLADYWGYIMVGAHLYNAVLKKKLNSKEIKDWPDMELLIKLRPITDDGFFFTMVGLEELRRHAVVRKEEFVLSTGANSPKILLPRLRNTLSGIREQRHAKSTYSPV